MDNNKPSRSLDLSDAALEQLKTIEESDRIFGTYHPETINQRQILLQMRFKALIDANGPLEFYLQGVKDALQATIDAGLEDIIDGTKWANHPAIQNIREQI